MNHKGVIEKHCITQGIEMTIAIRYEARAKHRCDICGAEDFWGASWSRMTSLLHDETCPDEVPEACSEKCMKEIELRIKDGRIELPKLRIGAGGADVVKPRRGY